MLLKSGSTSACMKTLPFYALDSQCSKRRSKGPWQLYHNNLFLSKSMGRIGVLLNSLILPKITFIKYCLIIFLNQKSTSDGRKRSDCMKRRAAKFWLGAHNSLALVCFRHFHLFNYILSNSFYHLVA